MLNKKRFLAGLGGLATLLFFITACNDKALNTSKFDFKKIKEYSFSLSDSVYGDKMIRQIKNGDLRKIDNDYYLGNYFKDDKTIKYFVVNPESYSNKLT
ncbi:MAG: hypothetical protein ACEPOV_02250 [Hyphomicrobiales bacterium]